MKGDSHKWIRKLITVHFSDWGTFQSLVLWKKTYLNQISKTNWLQFCANISGKCVYIEYPSMVLCFDTNRHFHPPTIQKKTKKKQTWSFPFTAFNGKDNISINMIHVSFTVLLNMQCIIEVKSNKKGVNFTNGTAWEYKWQYFDGYLWWPEVLLQFDCTHY